MIIGACDSGAGLFSHINFVVTHIDELGHANFLVDWTAGNPYVDCSGKNLFDSLFVQESQRPGTGEIVRDWPHHRYTGSNANSLYVGAFKWRWRLHGCWQNLQVRGDILAEVDAFCEPWIKDATAVHVRNCNIGTECPDGAAPGLVDYGRALCFGSGPVFLATDNEEAVDYFKDLLGDRLRVRKIARSPDMNTEYHLNHPQTAKDAKDARDCLIDALIMSRCGCLIHSVSNIATAVLYMNPAVPHVFITSRDACYLPPDSEDNTLPQVGSVVSRGEPCRVVHLDHPQWKDWVLVFEDHVVVRHSTGCTGLLDELEDGGIEIQWRDWEPEVFSPKPLTDPQSVANRLPLYYQLRRIKKVEVALQGGLGNQMFQYAFGLRVAKRLGAELVLSHDGNNRTFALRSFGLTTGNSIAHPDKVLEWHEDYEDGIEVEMIAEIAESNPIEIRIQGWFQNEKFFSPVAKDIRKCFAKRYPLPSFVGGRTAVAVHVRLGDYVHSDGHDPLPLAYYQKALAKMRSVFDNPLFLVFSDDPEGCPGWLRNQPDTTILPALYEFHAFGMMQSCAAFVIANSTFSWWAAWLSGSDHVICPDRFLPDKDWTICPDSWHPISVAQ